MPQPNDDLEKLNEIWGTLEDIVYQLRSLRGDLIDLENLGISLEVIPTQVLGYLMEAQKKQEEVGKAIDEVERSQRSNNVDFL